VLLNLFIILMLNRSVGLPQQGFVYECETRRQHFNHLRNTSTSMRNCLTWNLDQSAQIVQQDIALPSPHRQISQPNEEEGSARQRKNVSFDAKQNVETNLNKSKLNATAISGKKTNASQNTSFNAKERSRSVNPQRKRDKGESEDAEIMSRIRQR
jgi:hypothetical protein